MARGYTTTARETDCNSSAQRYSRALLLLAVTGLPAACGGGGAQSGWGSSNGSAGPNTATLTWDAVSDPNLSGYRVYYGTAPGTYLQSPGQGVNAGNVTTYTVTGLGGATTYYFVATTYDTSNRESTFSNEVSKTIP